MLGLVCKQMDLRFNTLSTVGPSQDGLCWRDELTIIKFMTDQGLGGIHHKIKTQRRCYTVLHFPTYHCPLLTELKKEVL